jgi:hypothetical protein
MTGKFENKGYDVLSDDSKQGHTFHDNTVSPVVHNYEALDMMNDYNSSQIMLLVNQMKSASQSGNGTCDED